ncbi:MAG TPA: baseplate J/gp47 family protein [Herpetosiphonaceae bacterium]
MTELGHPFSQSFQTLIEVLEEHIRSGVEQPAQTEFVFNGNSSSYILPQEVKAVTRVSGLVGGTFVIFTRNVDYYQAGNRLVWPKAVDPSQPGITPQPGDRFLVEYTYRDRPAGLTDFNPGSVIGTLVRALARELTLVYDQIDEAYRRAFVDYAQGAALDNVVALLGVVRNPALQAHGEVTFFTKKAPRDTIAIPDQTRVTDESGRVFLTQGATSIPRITDKNSAPVEQGVSVVKGMARVRNRIAEVVAIWDQASAEPNTGNIYPSPALSRDQPFGPDERTIKILPRGNEALPAQVRVRYIPRSVTVPVIALEPGTQGNVDARTIVVMPSPPRGVDGVVNEEALSGGIDAESDSQLRERARFALERSGNATFNAIKYAVLDVDTVTEVEVLDHSVDETIRLGEVHVRYAGSDADPVREAGYVRAAIERTRAAGVLVHVKTITKLVISGTIYVIPEPNALPRAAENLRSAVLEALRALGAGQALSLRRLGALAYSVGGLADVAEVQFQVQRQDPAVTAPAEPEPITSDPFPVGRGEVLTVDEAHLQVQLLVALTVVEAHSTNAGNFSIGGQLLDRSGAAAKLNNFNLTVDVTLRARPKDKAEDARETIASLSKMLSFSNNTTGRFLITKADLESYNPNVYAPEIDVVVVPSTYAGLRSDEAKKTITIE